MKYREDCTELGDQFTKKYECTGLGANLKTQYQVAREHLDLLENMVYFFRNIGHTEAQIVDCPNCNRDAVKVRMGSLQYMYIDDADFHGTKWLLLKYCEDSTTGMIRKEFKHED